MDKPDQALHTLHIALTLEPKHPMCKYQRAQIYSKLGKLPEALYELEELKEIVPKESLVYFLTGKVYCSTINFFQFLIFIFLRYIKN